MHLFFMVNMASSMKRKHVPYDDDVAQHGSHTAAYRLTKASAALVMYIFDIGHPCYGQNKESAEQDHLNISWAQV